MSCSPNRNVEIRRCSGSLSFVFFHVRFRDIDGLRLVSLQVDKAGRAGPCVALGTAVLGERAFEWTEGEERSISDGFGGADRTHPSL
jgi:hypothetical protein